MKQIAWMGVGWLVVCVAQAASFDCGKASTTLERMICGDSELSRLDDELAARYAAALRDKAHADFIRRAQQRWLATRAACHDAACVKRAYQSQLEVLGVPIVTTPVGKPVVRREYPDATLLADGRVLVSGGWRTEAPAAPAGWKPGDPRMHFEPQVDPRAEVFDPKTERFTPTGEMQIPRNMHSGMRLPDGTLLVLGGGTPESAAPANNPERYHPASGRFSVLGVDNCYALMAYGTFALLPGGRVLVTGWKQNGGGHSAEIYDPETGRCNPTGEMITPRTSGSAVLLSNGRVLLTGGEDERGNDNLTASELYDPASGAFSATGNAVEGRAFPKLLPLPDGKVLIAGGGYEMGNHKVELYDPATGRFVHVGTLMLSVEQGFVLKGGAVLFAGHPDAHVEQLWLERYDPATGTSRIAGRVPRVANDTLPVGVGLEDGRVLFIGSDGAEVYDPNAEKIARQRPGTPLE